MLQRIVATLLLVGIFGTITGCEAVGAFGRGVERTGEAIQDKAAR